MDKSELKKRTVKSTISLFFQSGYSALLGLAANLVLTILLTPAIFGIYITVLSLIALLNYFSDIGLAASLIQKKELAKNDLKTTFTAQQILVLSLILIGLFMTPYVKNFYNLPSEGIYLYLSLLLSFFLSSLKTIPSVLLERKIQFQKIVFVQIIENSVFYLSVIILAILGFGLQSFTYSVLLRAIVGVMVIYSISFWMPQIGISVKTLRRLLSFGIPFQTSSFLALFKDDLIILFLSKVLGFEGVGYIGWAKKWAEAPIRIIMDNISRVLFPVISLIQHDKSKISSLIEKILYYQTALLAPTLIGLALIMAPLVNIIPKYTKWEPALPIFYLFIISSFFSSYSTPFINLFNALGKVKISLFFMAVWTIATWVLTPLLTSLLGIYGFPLVQLLLSSSSVFVALTARKKIKFEFFSSMYKPLLSAIFMGSLVFVLVNLLTTTLASLIVTIILGILMYALSMRLFFKINLINEFRSLFKNE